MPFHRIHIEREGCALQAALEVVGERWSFLILRAALMGVEHFEDFQCSLGIARNVLSGRLARLVDHGLLTREPVAEDKRMVAYRLTEKGRDLLPAIVALRQWGEKWAGLGTTVGPCLADRRDQLPVRPLTLLAQDGRALSPADLCWISDPVTPDDAAT